MESKPPPQAPAFEVPGAGIGGGVGRGEGISSCVGGAEACRDGSGFRKEAKREPRAAVDVSGQLKGEAECKKMAEVRGAMAGTAPKNGTALSMLLQGSRAGRGAYEAPTYIQ